MTIKRGMFVSICVVVVYCIQMSFSNFSLISGVHLSMNKKIEDDKVSSSEEADKRRRPAMKGEGWSFYTPYGENNGSHTTEEVAHQGEHDFLTKEEAENIE